MASFRLFACFFFFFFSSFRLFATKRRRTKARNNARRKDKTTPGEKTTKLKFQMASFRMFFFFFCLFCAEILSFRVEGFVFSMALFCLFAWRFSFFSFFRVASFCLSDGVFSPPKTKRRNDTIQTPYICTLQLYKSHKQLGK